MSTLHKKSIIFKTLQVGGSTILSRMLGLLRDILLVRYMGAGVVSDAFRSAWMLPNMLRQVFAEGALSAAVIPTIVQMVKDGKKAEVNRLMTLCFLVFEGIVLAICALFIWKAELVIQWVTPGYVDYRAELAARLLRILMLFIFFVSSNALMAGPLQAVHQFLLPALSSSILNVFFISGLLLGIYKGLSVEGFCSVILLGGCFVFILHLITYIRVGFHVASIDRKTVHSFSPVLQKFIPTMISASVMQLSLLVDTRYASFLPAGSVTLFTTANGFLRLALGMIVAFSTVLLPHFARVVTYAPKRLSFYLLETAKLIFWLTLPITIMLSFLANKIFYTFFYSHNFTLAQVAESKFILMAFLLGLFFFSMNKVLMSIYYALHQMWVPAIITIIVTGINIFLNAWWVTTFQATGLALATVTSAAVQTVMFVALLYLKFNFRLYHLNFLEFLYRYLLQIIIIVPIFFGIYKTIFYLIIKLLPESLACLLTMTIAFWIWVVPLCCLLMIALFYTRTLFKVRLYFLK